MLATEVRSRADMIEYLARSAQTEYLESEGDQVRQKATFLKSYIVERHQHDDGTEPEWPYVFAATNESTRSITMLATRKGITFFCERIDPRFAMFHTISKTEETDAIMARLTGGVNSMADRAWLPSSFLLDSRGGALVGYKFASDPVRSAALVNRIEENSLVEDDEAPVDFAINDSLFGLRVFRSSSNSQAYAEQDLSDIYDSRLYANRRAIDWLETRSRLDNDVLIQSTTYSNGKIISQTPSAESHLAEVRRVTDQYGDLVRSIEDNYSIRWASTGAGMIRLGESILISFPEYEIPNLESFAMAAFSGASSFGLLGVPTQRGSGRIDVEAVDLHRGDRASFEITRNWIRLLLPEHSCGNVVCRFVWNLQRYFSSALVATTASGEVLFSEGKV